VAFLRRAKREPPSAGERSTLLVELGHAEALHRDPAARADLSRALALTADPVEAGRIAVLLADVLVYSGSVSEALDVAERAIDRLDGREPALGARLELLMGWITMFDARFVARLKRRLPRVRKLAESDGPAARPFLLLLGINAALRNGRPDAVLSLIHRGLDGGRLIADEGCDTPAIACANTALAMIDELDELERLISDCEADARRRGSVSGHALNASTRCCVQLRRGRITDAVAEGGTAFALAQKHQLRTYMHASLGFWAEALHVAGDSARALAALEAVDLAELESTWVGSALLYWRGLVRAGLGRRQEAVTDLRRCGATLEELGWRNPNMFPWRSVLAGAIAADDREQARQLVAEELRLARISGQPRAIGRASHALAVLEQPADIHGLRAAVAELERSPGQLELANALTDLGAALRRANRRADAREPLRRALDIAHHNGAATVAARARQELLVAGGRPRRIASRGIDALTPAERRACRLAAEGLSNPEIAQTLFVTRKAIEMHLSNAYRKLEIHSRAELPSALTPADLRATNRPRDHVKVRD
jgi:DNA-binding CsgD family transcriptional regulator